MARERVEITEEVLENELFLIGKRDGFNNNPETSQHELYRKGWKTGEAERLKELE